MPTTDTEKEELAGREGCCFSNPEAGSPDEKVKLTRLTESDDVEAYLTMFERLMQAHGVEATRRGYKLVPELTGRPQQAYAALPSEQVESYEQLKIAILQRYDINAETYRQQLRALCLLQAWSSLPRMGCSTNGGGHQEAQRGHSNGVVGVATAGAQDSPRWAIGAGEYSQTCIAAVLLANLVLGRVRLLPER